MKNDRFIQLFTQHCRTLDARHSIVELLSPFEQSITKQQHSNVLSRLPQWLLDLLDRCQMRDQLESPTQVLQLSKLINDLPIYHLHTAYQPSVEQFSSLHQLIERIFKRPLLIQHVYSPQILGGFILETPSGHRFSQTLSDKITASLSATAPRS